MNIIQARLTNQFLGRKKIKTVHDAVAWFGAVQAQEYASSKWGLSLRLMKTTDAQMEDAFTAGTILRTHVMRPTWHFVVPEDIRWMQKLTAPRVRKLLAPYDRKLGIDRRLISKTNSLFEKVLQKKNFLTRDDLAELLNKNGINASGQKLGHIVMHAELDAVVCSGPRLGKQFSYALLEERAPIAAPLNRDEALATLARKYFQSHGPAQVKDFAWWSGLTLREAQVGIDSVSHLFDHDTIQGKKYWYSSGIRISNQKSPAAQLLSIYDEYTIAYKDRSALGGEKFYEKFVAMGNALTGLLIIDGTIAGTWKRLIKKETVNIVVSALRQLRMAEKEGVEIAAKGLGKFLDMECTLVIRR